MARFRFAAFAGLFVFVALACASCAGYSGGQVYSSPAWKQSGGNAGKVLLIVAGWQVNDADYMQKEHTAMVTRATIEALNHLPGTTVLNAGDMPVLWAADVSDAQAVSQARARGADSVCVMTVGAYRGSLAIGLPVLWNVHTDILYSLRLVDVKTGDLLAHAVTNRMNGGNYWFVPFDDLNHGMEQSLRYSLWHPDSPAPAPAASAGAVADADGVAGYTRN